MTRHLARDRGRVHGKWILTSKSDFKRFLSAVWVHLREGEEEGHMFSWLARLFTVSGHVQIIRALLIHRAGTLRCELQTLFPAYR
jgi:hypothetical protein